MTTPDGTAAPSLFEATGRIENASSDLDALQGHILHIAELAQPPNGEGDPALAQTCYALANAIRAIKDEIDSAVEDLGRIERGQR